MVEVYRLGIPIRVPTEPEEVAAFTMAMTERVHELRHHSNIEDCPSTWCRTARAMVALTCENTAHRGYNPDSFVCPDCGGSWIYEPVPARGRMMW